MLKQEVFDKKFARYKQNQTDIKEIQILYSSLLVQKLLCSKVFNEDKPC